MEKLHPGVKWSFRIGTYIFLIFLGTFLSFFIFVPLFVVLGGYASLIGIIFWLVFVIGLGEIYTQLAYKNWKYEFTSTNLKVERGVIWKRYSNIPYERVQNVDITRGIIARILGYSSVHVQTAGYSGGYGRGGRRVMPEGYLPGVNIEKAEKIREFLIKKITHKSSGL